MLTKPWQTSAWKKKREELLMGRRCVWCGSVEGLVVHHPQHFHGLREYKKSTTLFMRKYFSTKDNEGEKERLLVEAGKDVNKTYSYLCPDCGHLVYARRTISPQYKCKNCGTETDNPTKRLSDYTRSLIRRRFRFLFLKYHKEEIDRLFAQTKEMADEEYHSFKDVMILCKRCHYAKEKGLVLCKVCGQKYHRPKYSKCWACFKKTEGGREIIMLDEPIVYHHPWCGKAIKILRKWWEAEANPKMCCIKHCDVNPDSCQTATAHWA